MSPMAVVFMPWQDKAERHLLSTQPSSGIFGVKPHLCSKLQFALIISREVFPRKKKNLLCTKNYPPVHHFVRSGQRRSSSLMQQQQGSRHCFWPGTEDPKAASFALAACWKQMAEYFAFPFKSSVKESVYFTNKRSATIYLTWVTSL